MNAETIEKLVLWAETYNDPVYFEEDPIAFPRRFVEMMKAGRASLKDVEVAAAMSAHLAWGRRAMIVRDAGRLFDEMGWKPYDYVMKGEWRDDATSLHRTIKWSEIAAICSRLKAYYEAYDSLETMAVSEMRTAIYGSKPDAKAPNKKINMMRRWMVRDDGRVDLGLWKSTDPASLIIPLDVHVYDEAVALGLTARKSKDLATALEITRSFDEIFPGDPCKGDFALFGYGVNNK
ncbi:MAG: DUF2400 domain-containing protein [Bacteroidales bacterium]|nr:DUF2400 domain-containing protein [Bacteroidales bacterium]